MNHPLLMCTQLVQTVAQPTGNLTYAYDAIGNPLNDGKWDYSWVQGRQLRSMYKGEFGEADYDELTFEYNADGLRTKKERMYLDAGGSIAYQGIDYTLHGRDIVHLADNEHEMHFFYDAQNKPAVALYDGVAYAYMYNLQGDVIALVNASGTKVVEYRYDAWGKLLSKTGSMASTLGTLNPFRYRGYVYDEETGLYYLRSRYYNPEWSRFVNADCFIEYETQISSHNIFAYCRNQPINCIDSNGTFVFVLTTGLEDIILFSDYDTQYDQNNSKRNTAYEIITGAVIPMQGPPNGYLSGHNGHGDLYESWYDSDGNVERVRHHSNHGNEKRHPKNPHDHKGIKDKNGKPTLSPEAEDPDPDYKSPESDVATNASNALSGVLAAYLLYKGIRLIGGLIAVPATGGASLIPALVP